MLLQVAFDLSHVVLLTIFDESLLKLVSVLDRRSRRDVTARLLKLCRGTGEAKTTGFETSEMEGMVREKTHTPLQPVCWRGLPGRKEDRLEETVWDGDVRISINGTGHLPAEEASRVLRSWLRREGRDPCLGPNCAMGKLDSLHVGVAHQLDHPLLFLHAGGQCVARLPLGASKLPLTRRSSKVNSTFGRDSGDAGVEPPLIARSFVLDIAVGERAQILTLWLRSRRDLRERLEDWSGEERGEDGELFPARPRAQFTSSRRGPKVGPKAIRPNDPNHDAWHASEILAVIFAWSSLELGGSQGVLESSRVRSGPSRGRGRR
ncbi:hypothetical protein M407DRAFT_5000 [Tulasnella calospora MUT 4182]|uniref:Uncharacterized protein n=1 Tax=Tulasnella calospora MUT 4182 TaxID=1051891 RepID=A0A0C3QHW2_9AGAM|nr:hypothetical protein M407DRAFT_5000 [Tulasnella calospora MUT 4182]